MPFPNLAFRTRPRLINPAVVTGSITIGSRKTKKQKGKRNAEKRIGQSSAPAGAAARSKSERARLSAFHRGSRQSVHYLLTQLQARLPGTWSRRALPALSCPSPGSYQSREIPGLAPAPVVVPAGMMPGAARKRVTSSLAGTALAPSIGRRRLRSLNHERDLRVGILEFERMSRKASAPIRRAFLSLFGRGRAAAAYCVERKLQWLSSPIRDQRSGRRRRSTNRQRTADRFRPHACYDRVPTPNRTLKRPTGPRLRVSARDVRLHPPRRM
jgi:hypothetical protein